jgi:hypothetical protein
MMTAHGEATTLALNDILNRTLYLQSGIESVGVHSSVTDFNYNHIYPRCLSANQPIFTGLEKEVVEGEDNSYHGADPGPSYELQSPPYVGVAERPAPSPPCILVLCARLLTHARSFRYTGYAA